jgi:spore germination protein YaaH
MTTLVNYGDIVDPGMLATARAFNVSVLGNGCCPPAAKGCAACPRGWTRTPLLFNASQRQLAIVGMVDFVATHDLAGVNLDLEGTPRDSAAAVSSFVCGLRAELQRRRPSSVLAFDGPMLPTCYQSARCNRSIPDVENYRGRFDFVALAQCVDLVLPMGYDLTGSAPDGGEAASNAPLAVVTEGLDEWLALGVPPGKLALLLPWYGYDMACRPTAAALSDPRPGSASSISGCRVQLPWGTNNHECGFGTIMLWKQEQRRRQQLALGPGGVAGRDADGSPWFVHHNASGWRRKVYYDDAVSIARKVAMCSSKGIAGVGVWTVDTLQPLRATAAPTNASAAMWAALWPQKQH